MTKGGKDSSVPWENPKTGARGTVTPLASAYNQDGITCRDFLASYVKNGSESWLQGAACRAAARQVGSAQFAALEEHLARFVSPFCGPGRCASELGQGSRPAHGSTYASVRKRVVVRSRCPPEKRDANQRSRVYTLTAVMIPSGKISSGSAWRCAMPCSWV